MTRLSIRGPQILRISLLLIFVSLLYSFFSNSNSANPRKDKTFRRPKFNKVPKQNSAMSAQYLKSLANRRSIYALGKLSPVSVTRLQEIVTEVLLHTPSSFNNQAGRAVLLVGDAHDKLWDIADTHIKSKVPEAYDGLKSKLKGYRDGYGTILFFEDGEILRGLKAKKPEMPFDQWSQHSQGMLQIHAWDALELEGLGANLQHYNMFPGLEDTVKETWNLSKSWELHAQLVFGKPLQPAREKVQTPIEQRLKTFDA